MRRNLALLAGRSRLIRHRLQRISAPNQAVLVRHLDELDRLLETLATDLDALELRLDGRRF